MRRMISLAIHADNKLKGNFGVCILWLDCKQSTQNSTKDVQEEQQSENTAQQRHQEEEQTKQDRQHTSHKPWDYILDELINPLFPNKMITKHNNKKMKKENCGIRGYTFLGKFARLFYFRYNQTKYLDVNV